MFEFKILKKAKKNKARMAEFTTPHGKLITPELAFVATESEFTAIPKEFMPKLPVNLIIVNTYHLWTKKIVDKFAAADFNRLKPISTVHNYTNFPKPTMSDSGGFQVFSLGFGKSQGVGKIANIFPEETKRTFLLAPGKLKPQKNIYKQSDTDNPLTITMDGVEFTFDNKRIILTPEKSMQIQQRIGADIIFAFDECTSPLNTYEYTKNALDRTHEWLLRCVQKLKSVKISQSQLKSETADSNRFQQIPTDFNSQALFAIIQGGEYEDLRIKSAKFMVKQDIPGFAIGGSLGMSKEDMFNILEWVNPLLPEEKPRHLLGIGQVRDIFEGVERGVDTFDCVIPTREARHKVLYTKKGKISLRKMKNEETIIERSCKCNACSNNVTMKQLHNLFLQKHPLAFFYSTAHNIQFYSDLMKNIRESIEQNKFTSLKEKYLHYYL